MGAINHTHTAAVNLFDDSVVAEGLADKGIVTDRFGGHGKASFLLPL